MVRRIYSAVCWLVFLVLLAAPAAAADPPQVSEEDKQKRKSPYVQATRNKQKKSAPAKSYSNEDLERMFGRSTPTEPPSGESSDAGGEADDDASKDDAGKPDAPPDPLTKLFEDEKKRDEHEAKVAAATQRVVAAERKITELERRALAIRNPLLPRPKAPEEGAEEWNAADTTGRLEQNQAAIEAAREELAKAREELAQLQQSAP